MHELHAILDAWRTDGCAMRDAVLATVVHVSGSAYRRPGARMLILPDGRRIGSVSGGCLEGEIARKACWLTEGGTPVVRAYDTTSADDTVWEFGLGCNGVVHVMLERTSAPATAESLAFLTSGREVGTPAAVAVVLRVNTGSSARVGDRLLVDASGVKGGALAGTALGDGVRPHAADVLDVATSRLVHLDDADVFIEWIGPPLSLVVFGAGDDAVPLVGIAKTLGWRVTVADGRPAYARSGRFPGAERVVVMAARHLLDQVELDADTVVVMMTHNYPLDERLLPLVLDHQPRYLGLLGPRSRAERLFADLGARMPDFVHAPIGLDVGGDSPAAAALSIAAEIQAATHRRAGGMLRLRAESIHPPVVEVGMSVRELLAEPARPAYCETLVGSHV